jgi:CRP/FNR family transcriptional regulator
MSPLKRQPFCAACGHTARGLFCSLAGEHLEHIDRHKTVRHYRRGQPVFHEGDPPDTLYCIYSGLVRLYKIGQRDEEIVIRLLRAGDVMGYRPMLANEPIAASARAIEDTTICLITRSAIFAVLRDSPDLALTLMGKLAVELRVSEDEMVARVSRTAAQRVARFLLWLMSGFPQANDPHNIDLPLRREDMAHIIGTTPETLSRVLHDFARRGILHLDRRSIRVRDLAGLRGAAEEVPARSD